ncbi:MAG: MCP four helix bundle domain-containing protein [Desulfobacteraceae bacterium]|nr:MCP four helix bundle domain-containing protein [Desulfobacteraceae bacterium]
MKKLTVFKRLVLGYLLVLLIVIALGVYSTAKLDEMSRLIHSISSVDSETISMAREIRDTVLSQRSLERKYFVSGDSDFHLQFMKADQYLQKNLEQISMLMNSGEKKRLIADVKQTYQTYISMVQEEVLLKKTNKGKPEKGYSDEKEALVDDIIKNLQNVIKITETAMDSKMEKSGQIGFQAARVTMILTIGLIVLAILISFYNALTIGKIQIV